MLRPAAPHRTPAWPLQPRNQPRTSRLAAPGRRRRLAAHDGTLAGGGGDDDVLPQRPTDPDLTGLTSSDAEWHYKVDRFIAEKQAFNLAKQRHELRAEARKATGAPQSPLPLACLAAAWPPATDSTLPASSAARTAAAEAAAAAAVAFACTAVGHEAAAEAARAAAATKPASAQVAAGEEWLRAGAAWRKAFDSLEAAQRAQPDAAVVVAAAAQVEAACALKRQLRSLTGQVAGDLP